MSIQNKGSKTGTQVGGGQMGANGSNDDERLKIMMAMSLLILKNIQYDDQGED